MTVRMIRMGCSVRRVYAPDVGAADFTKAGIGGTAQVSISFNSAGTASQVGATSTTPGAFTWLLAGASSDYEIYFTSPGATAVSGSAEDTWLGMGTNRSWVLSATNDFKTYTGTYTIRIASGSVDIATGSVQLDVDSTP